MFSKEEKTIVRMEFGSKLYGTSTPESDTDYKFIYLPSVYQLVTGEYPEVITNGTGDGGACFKDGEHFIVRIY